MASHGVICEVISYLLSKHGYGSPVAKNEAVNLCGVRNDQIGEAKDAFEELRSGAPFIIDCGDRGIKIDNSEFGLLADYLYAECNWSISDIESKLKHYEGWSNHEWHPEG
jgi:hypothetical protein